MEILKESILIVALWLISWGCLGAGLDLYKKGEYKPSAIGFVSAFMCGLYLIRTILFM